MPGQKTQNADRLAQLLARPRRKVDQSAEAQLRRLREYYVRLSEVGGFPPPPADAEWDALKTYRAQYLQELADADILDEIQRISRGELL